MSVLWKYNRTYHLPWSPGLQNDDRVIESVDVFNGKKIIVTEKMDGENASLYHDHYHARSLDSRHHASRDWIKSFHGQIKNDIPVGWRICGENMYAKHSIFYDDLPSYFLGFSVWNEDNVCLNWNDTLMVFEMLGIVPVPRIWSGQWEDFHDCHKEIDFLIGDRGKEGYVVRITDSYDYNNFKRSVAKYVRRDHVQTDQHWMQAEIVPNQLRNN